MTAISHSLQSVLERIAAAERNGGRSHGEVRLIAVSKTKPAADIRAAYSAGQNAFGESYVQEALEKIQALADLAIEWHFVGPIQSNKTAAIAAAFDWVHSVDRIKIARRLSEQRPAGREPLNLCLQVNVSGESTKSGVTPGALAELAAAVTGLPHVRLRGLMAIPQPFETMAEQRAPLRALRQLYDDLNAIGLALDTLSMGMSNDLEAAVAEGATMVRIGTAVFGPRAPKTG